MVMKNYEDKRNMVSEDIMTKVDSFVYLQIMDQSWKDHLRSMDQLQDSVRLRGYGQEIPFTGIRKAFSLFSSLMTRIEDETALALIRMPPPTGWTVERIWKWKSRTKLK